MVGNANNNKLNALNCLVVEDNVFASIDICNKLQALGVENVTTACNGLDGLDKIDKMVSPPGVILLDLRMPIMGGAEMLSRLSDRKYPGSVIIVSGVDKDTLSAVEKLAHDCNIKLAGSMTKPTNQQALSELLLQCVDQPSI